MADRPIVVDAALFLSMHANDEAIRCAGKTFFVGCLDKRLWMSLEQVGLCDDVVWSYPRAVQDAYYPFMDTLHSQMEIRRCGYTALDLTVALEAAELRNLPVSERLLMAQVQRLAGQLYTAAVGLAERPELSATLPPGAAEQPFPPPLERLYQNSLALRVARDLVEGTRCTAAPSSPSSPPSTTPAPCPSDPPSD